MPDNESVSPLDADAVVPVRLVKARVGLPCEWLDSAAVVRYAPPSKEIPELLTVQVTLVLAVFNPTASFEALAVVR